ncbi:MAG: hypothetical protein Q9M20_04065 [Mariprofundaceae bacterium]|nr:hypothetical protein [Mariprofundaceae bacterium]
MIHKSIASEVGVRVVETRPVMLSKQLMADPIDNKKGSVPFNTL